MKIKEVGTNNVVFDFKKGENCIRPEFLDDTKGYDLETKEFNEYTELSILDNNKKIIVVFNNTDLVLLDEDYYISL